MATITGKLSNFYDVGAFHHKFGLPDVNVDGPIPRLISADLAYFRLDFLQEELSELKQAYEDHDLPGIADALVDLVYVALGTAHFHGLPWEELWDEVQRANMTKERAPSAEASKRNSTFDVIKPEGWQPPAIAATLAKYGWKCDGNHSEPRCGNNDCWLD